MAEKLFIRLTLILTWAFLTLRFNIKMDIGLNKETIRSAKRILLVLIAVNAVMIFVTIGVAVEYPVLLTPAILAYTLGLRHAVDADHIAAIDNVTRKLLAENKQSVTVGLFFSLGHSSVVVCLSILVVFSASFLSTHLETSKEIGSIVGTTVSACFLFIIGSINMMVFRNLWVQWKRLEKKNWLEDEKENHIDAMNSFPSTGGVLFRCCPMLTRAIDASWKMFPLGFLFGLGFDTASEVALLGISAIASKQGLPAPAIMLLPLLFTAGMSLLDTLDGILMLWAYGWASIHPAKKLFYNMFLTGTSACVAFLVGAIETSGILVDQLHLEGIVWEELHALSENFESLGFAIIGIFMLSFFTSWCIFRYKYPRGFLREQVTNSNGAPVDYGSLS